MCMSKRNSLKRSRRSAGFTLIEVLVSMIVFSVGVLSIVALQVFAKKANFDALQRTQSSYLAQDLLERMRLNTDGLDTYLAAGQLGGATIAVEPAPNCQSAANPCTADESATHDMWHWEQMLDGTSERRGANNTGGLVDPTACVAGPVGGGQGIYTVSIAWRGVTELANPPGDQCGAGLGKYGPADAFRRLLTVQTFITDI